MGKNFRTSSVRKLIFSRWLALGWVRIPKMVSMSSFPAWLSCFSWMAWDKDGVQSSLSIVSSKSFCSASVSSPCLLIQLSRCSYSSANHPGDLLPVWEFTLRDCCATMATIRICVFCCRHPNVSNLCFRFVWRMDIIYFQNSYCRKGGVKNE